jgi:hypothetical protein
MNRETIISSINSSDKKTTDYIPVSLSNQLISLLSEQLYQSPLKAIEELVVNSYDAGAKTCKVVVPIDPVSLESAKVLVFDDGSGMNVSGLINLWAIGGSGKRDEGDTIDGRKIIGKFGIGKLATYAIANQISYITRKGDTIFLNSLDYNKFKNDPTGGNEAVHLPVSEIKNFSDLKADQTFKELVNELSLEMEELLGAEKISWTMVILENLKTKIENLKIGRLKWVLSTSMPINPSFQLFLNGNEIESSKLTYELALTFKVSELPEKRIQSLNESSEDVWKIEDGKLISNTFPKGIEGIINITKRTLLGGKSSEISRSHGFFIKVRGRIINQDDETFGSVPTKMGTFNRMHATIEADDLDKVITASRESLENSKEKKLFQEFLDELLNEATSRYNSYLKEFEKPELRKKEGERNYVNHELMEYPIADTLMMTPSHSLLGGEPDSSFFYIDFGDLSEREELVKDFYSNSRSKYTFNYTKGNKSGRLVKLDVKSKTFWINENHPFIKANLDDISSKSLLEDFVVAETMLEVYLTESGLPSNIIGEILEKRDRLLNGLAQDHPISVKFLADALRDSSSNDLELEINQVIAVRALGFTAKHMAGAGHPDGIATFNTYSDGLKVLTLEAKSSKDTPGLSQLDFAGLQQHMLDNKATGCLLIAPSYPGESVGENAAAAKRAKELKISCWTIEQLAMIIENSESRKITAPDVINIIEKAYTPEEVTAAVNNLLAENEWSYSELYNAVVTGIESMETRMPNSLRTIDSITTAVSFSVGGMENISKETVSKALKDISHISKGALVLRDENVFLFTSISELKQRMASHTGGNGSSRREGKFK